MRLYKNPIFSGIRAAIMLTLGVVILAITFQLDNQQEQLSFGLVGIVGLIYGSCILWQLLRQLKRRH